MKVLIVVDVQNDFCPGGSLGVRDGKKIIPFINSLLDSNEFGLTIGTQDWHPGGHISFASVHGKNPFDIIDAPYGKQMLWPAHCIQGTNGAEFPVELHDNKFQYIVRKGMNKNIDSYSAIKENDHHTLTRLHMLLEKNDSIYIVGIATDVCVLNTALDCKGFDTHVLLGGCAGVSDEGVEKAICQMRENNIIVD